MKKLTAWLKPKMKFLLVSLFFENGKPGLQKIAFALSLASFFAMAWISFFSGKQIPSAVSTVTMWLGGSSIAVKGIGIARNYLNNSPQGTPYYPGPQNPNQFNDGPMG